ncbi:MAG: PAS domain S-box protein, partial [Pseudohongiellaceae bacterium]
MAHSSLKKRFIWAAIPLLAVLAAVIFYSQSLVNETADQSIRTVAEIRHLERSINDIRSTLQTLEQLVYQRTVISYRDNSNTKEQIEAQLDFLNSQMDDFIANSTTLHTEWQEANKGHPESFTALTAQIKQTLKQITQDIDRYNQIIADVRVRFPASRIIIDELFPLNVDFTREVNLALNEVSDLPDIAENRQTYNLLLELRYAWLQQVSQFRLFVANRSGMFDTPEDSMTSNLQNRNLYSRKADEIITDLENKSEAGKLSFQTSFSVEAARNIYHEYENHFKSIQHYYMSDGWRIDHEFLHNTLQPSFKNATRIIDDISNKIKFYTTETITRTQNVVSTITTMIWLTGAALVGLMVLGYLVFERIIRRPLLMMADVINAEASGKSFYPIMDSNIRETQLLVDAFHNMQKQVHSRQARLESILGSAAEGIITMDADGMIESFNKAAEELFGYQADTVVGENINYLFPEEIQARGDSYVGRLCHGDITRTDSEIETVGLHRDGSTFPMSIKVSEMNIGGKLLYTALVDDVSERITMISNLRHL